MYNVCILQGILSESKLDELIETCYIFKIIKSSNQSSSVYHQSTTIHLESTSPNRIQLQPRFTD